MTSTRLPGKVLMDIGGRPCLVLLLDRLRRASEVDDVLVATSVEGSDDVVEEAARGAGVQVVRGPLTDVLERYRMAAEAAGADGVVRITSDCPLIDPQEVDRVVTRWRAGDEDFVANCFEPRTIPKGLDTEVLSREVIDASAAEATTELEREHVTPFARAHPQRFRHVRLDLDPPRGDVRVTLDTEEDLRVIRAVVERVGTEAGLAEIVAAYDAMAGSSPAPTT